MLLFPPPEFRNRRRRPAAAAPPVPGTVTAAVRFVDGDRFLWQFDQPFDDPFEPWDIADFAALRVGGVPPAGFDEIVGVDGALTLTYPATFAPGLPWSLADAPAPLVFPAAPGGLVVPQSGVVTTP